MSDRDPGIYSQETAVAEIGDGLWQIDLGFQDRAGVIAAYLMAGDGELASSRPDRAHAWPTCRPESPKPATTSVN